MAVASTRTAKPGRAAPVDRWFLVRALAR
jgi:hypothetical protein